MNEATSSALPSVGRRALSLAAWGTFFGFWIGLAVGFSRIQSNAYLAHGLYRSAFLTFRSALLWTVPVCLVAALVLGVLWLIGDLASRWFHRRRARSPRRTMSYFLVLLALLSVGSLVLIREQAKQWIKATELGASIQTLSHGSLRWAAAGAVLILGIPAIFLVRALLRWDAACSLRSGFLHRLRIPGIVLLIGGALMASAGMIAPAGSHEPGRRMNVLLVTVDTLRADRLGCYGNPRKDVSPRIDRLAETGIRFRNAHAQSPWTLPSVASLMTSLYPQQHAVVRKNNVLSHRIVTLAETFQNAGYQTMAVTDNRLVSGRYGLDQGFETFRDISVVSPPPTAPKLTRIALELLHDDSPRPFFLWVHYLDPHSPYLDHDDIEYVDTYQGPLPRVVTSDALKKITTSATPEDVKFIEQMYEEEVHFDDQWIGQLLDGVQELGLLDDTLVVLTADHGEQFHERGRFEHGYFLYQELINVPLIMAGAVPPELRGKVVQSNVESSWIPRTLGTLCGLRQDLFQGLDLLEIARTDRDEEFCFSAEYAWKDKEDGGALASFEVGPLKQAVRFQRWKLILNVDSKEFELYDLTSDPTEERNLWSDSEQPLDSIRELLRTKLEEFGRGADVGKASITIELDEDELQHLRELGYVADDENPRR